MTTTWQPQSEKEVSGYLKEWQTGESSLLPCGNGSRLKRHFPYPNSDHSISSAKLKKLMWIDPEDRTCEVQSGISPLELENSLASHQLSLGVSAAQHREGTLGGLFLAPDHSLLSRRFGFSRDQVLGGRWALADGTVISSGARVVKSVAGYDLTRLLLGSRGQLAFCISLILKLRPSKKIIWHQGSLDSSTPMSPSAHYHFSLENQIWFADEEDTEVPGFRQVSETDGEKALASARQAFGLAQVRLHQAGAGHPPPGLSPRWKILCHDWSSNTCAIGLPPEANLSVTIADLQTQFPSALIVPETIHPPWLREISHAMAPHARPFGPAHPNHG